MSFEGNIQNTTATIKLQKLDHVPNGQDLQLALGQARNTTAAVIELPWKTPSSPATYVLKVSSGEGAEETNWVLHKGETLDAAVLWSFDSDDISLIESLIVAECDSVRDLGLAADQPVNADITVRSSATSSTSQASAPGPRSIPSPSLPAGVSLDLNKINQVAELFREQGGALVEEKFFLYFLLKEFERYCYTGAPLALVIFRIRVNYGDGKIGFLPERAAQEAVTKVNQILRGIDIFSRYQDNKYAIILPGSSANGGVQCVQALEKSLMSEPLQPGLDPHQLRFSAGIASVPDTCDKLEVLIAAALDALKQSAEGSSSMVVFPSVSRSV